MPFEAGNNANPAGRPRKGTSLKELLRNNPIKDKRALVKTAYREAIAGSVQWAEWIAKHSGEGADMAAELPDGIHLREVTFREIIVERPQMRIEQQEQLDVVVDRE